MSLFEHSVVFRFDNEVDYSSGGVVSKQVMKNEKGNVSLFAFDKGEGLSEHTAPFDALIQVIEGEAVIIIGGNPHTVTAGESIIMPANIPHGLKATQSFKMILTMIRA
ncbi:MAG: cupin domain-containing protein [Bacteroidetes bacterium]|nr:cupin domain-containing protein [Bacteroidota bacterium]